MARASRSAKAPAPQKRSATRRAPASAAAAPSASARSPASVACRKPPGGGTASASPNATCGGASLDDDLAVVGDPRQVEPLGGGDELAPLAASSGPAPRRSKSSPPSVAVAWMSSGLPTPRRSRGERAAPRRIAPARPGANSGQASMATMSCARARMKPTLSRPSTKRRGTSRGAGPRHARRRAAPTSASTPARSSACDERRRASTSRRGAGSCAGRRSRRSGRNRGRSARRARGCDFVATTRARSPSASMPHRLAGQRQGRDGSVGRHAFAARVERDDRQLAADFTHAARHTGIRARRRRRRSARG